MINITINLPNDVAREYFIASDKLSVIFGDPVPNAQSLMRFILAGFTSDEVVRHFDLTLRHMNGVPVPNEPETYRPDQTPEA